MTFHFYIFSSVYFIKEIKSKTWFIKDIFMLSKKEFGAMKILLFCRLLFLGRGYTKIFFFAIWQMTSEWECEWRRKWVENFILLQINIKWKFFSLLSQKTLFIFGNTYFFGTHQEFIYFYWKIQSGENGAKRNDFSFHFFAFMKFFFLITKEYDVSEYEINMKFSYILFHFSHSTLCLDMHKILNISLSHT